jgi:8-oxo-dGTP pyrophosphatase MutT (NUDIX family)
MNRQDLITDLKNYKATDSEKSCIPRFLSLLHHDRCLYRDHFDDGHITGSALLLNPEGDKILMNHHKALNRWLNFGGHADGDADILNAAIRETMEESGITAFKPVTAGIIDIDIHAISANSEKGEPEHFHYDIRYVMRMTEHQKPVISDESTKLKWMSFDEAISMIPQGDSLIRLINKYRDYSDF